MPSMTAQMLSRLATDISGKQQAGHLRVVLPQAGELVVQVLPALRADVDAVDVEYAPATQHAVRSESFPELRL